MPDHPITREEITRAPYAAIHAKVGLGPRTLMLLGRYDHDDLHWISSDRVVLVTRGGRLVKTVGFPSDLRQTGFAAGDPIIGNAAGIEPDTIHVRYLDIMPGDHFAVPIRSTYAVEGSEQLEIVERSYATTIVKERGSAPDLDWEFENTFWVDPKSGFVWRSLQHFAPGMPPVEISILKPALGHEPE